MTRNNGILLYTEGSAARKLEPELPERTRSRLPKRRRVKRPVLYYDPVALCSLLVTVVMLVLLVTGVVRYCQAAAEADRLEQRISQLQQENTRLRETYEEGYDLQDIRQKALDMGLVPVEQVQTRVIQVTLPESGAEDPGFWQQVWETFLSLFA
jgi:hypothetical protein